MYDPRLIHSEIKCRDGVKFVGKRGKVFISPTQENTKQKCEGKHPCLKRDSNPRTQRQSDQGLASDSAATGTGLCAPKKYEVTGKWRNYIRYLYILFV